MEEWRDINARQPGQLPGFQTKLVEPALEHPIKHVGRHHDARN